VNWSIIEWDMRGFVSSVFFFSFFFLVFFVDGLGDFASNCGVTGGSGYLTLVSLERGEQCGHFDTN
jgi:hypothetical protein